MEVDGTRLWRRRHWPSRDCISDTNGSGIAKNWKLNQLLLLEPTAKARVTLVGTESKQEGTNSLPWIPSSQSPVVPPIGRSG